MDNLIHELRSRLGRALTSRESSAISELVKQHGAPAIEPGEPSFRGDARRPIALRWMINREQRTVVIPVSPPAERPRNLVREHFERLGREQGGAFVTETRRIGLDGRRTVERQVEQFPPRTDQARRSTPRPRGAGRPALRGSSRRSSARSGDSGQDDQPSEPERHLQPPARRLCQFCGNDIPADRSPRARYCSERHADRDRQRRKRERDRVRAQLPRVPTTADFRRMLELDAETAEKLRQISICRCNGSHQEFEPGECFRCGHWLPREIAGGVRLVEAFFERLAREDRERRGEAA